MIQMTNLGRAWQKRTGSPGLNNRFMLWRETVFIRFMTFTESPRCCFLTCLVNVLTANMEEWFSLMSNHQLAINWKQWLLFACFRVYIPNWVTLKLSVLSPHNIKINHQQQQQKKKNATVFCPPITKFMRHSVAYCCCACFFVSSVVVKFAVVFHRPFWPWQITLDGLSSFSFWIIWARHDGGSQIAHGNGFP